VVRRRPPDLRYVAGVGVITLYTYLWQPGEHWDPRPAATVDRTRAALDAWTARGLRGCILDLRKHNGGSYRPGLHAVGRHLLRGCTLFAWSRDSSVPVDSALRQRNWVLYGEDDREQHDRRYSGNAKAPGSPRVAVLLGPGTASSGEILAAAFHGKLSGTLSPIRRPGVRTPAPRAGCPSIRGTLWTWVRPGPRTWSCCSR
jgi:C-terminal processing protease CtpA/Prc